MSIYAITGGAGFIGSHLADALLAAGHQVRILDDLSTGRIENLDPRCDFIRGDVCDAGLLRRALHGAAGCFHLAAIASVVRANEDWVGTSRVNLGGTIAVFDAASSAAIYGPANGVAQEDATPAPITAYGADKRASELHARAGFLVHGLPTLGLRFFNVYGPRQDPNSPYSGVISIFAEALRAGRPVLVFGDGLQTRDLVYVADVVAHLIAGMHHIAHHPGSLVLNVCTGRKTSVLAMAQIIGTILGRQPAIQHQPARPGDIRHSLGSPALAASVLGISATTGLPDGLAATLDSLINNALLPA